MTGILRTARISPVEVIMSGDKWIKIVNVVKNSFALRGAREVMGSIPVGDSDFLCPMLVSFTFNIYYWAQNSPFFHLDRNLHHSTFNFSPEQSCKQKLQNHLAFFY